MNGVWNSAIHSNPTFNTTESHHVSELGTKTLSLDRAQRCEQMSFGSSCFGPTEGSSYSADHMNRTCQQVIAHAGGGFVIVCGMFCWDSIRVLICLEGSLNGLRYISVLADRLNPFKQPRSLFFRSATPQTGQCGIGTPARRGIVGEEFHRFQDVGLIEQVHGHEPYAARKGYCLTHHLGCESCTNIECRLAGNN